MSTKSELKEYRNQLVLCEQKSQEMFDKTVLALSGGALGVSFAFIRDVIGDGPITGKNILLFAWVFWGASIVSELFSFYFSNLALRRAIIQVDKDVVYNERPGGLYDCITAVLNFFGGFLFFGGVILLIVFASKNLN